MQGFLNRNHSGRVKREKAAKQGRERPVTKGEPQPPLRLRDWARQSWSRLFATTSAYGPVVSSGRSLRSLLDHFRVAAARQPLRDESAGYVQRLR